MVRKTEKNPWTSFLSTPSSQAYPIYKRTFSKHFKTLTILVVWHKFILLFNYTKSILIQQLKKSPSLQKASCFVLRITLSKMWPGSVMVEPVTELMLSFTEVSEFYQENLLLQKSCGLLCCWKSQVGLKGPWKYHSSLCSYCSYLFSSPSKACCLNGFSLKFLPVFPALGTFSLRESDGFKYLCCWQVTDLPSILLGKMTFEGLCRKGWKI